MKTTEIQKTFNFNPANQQIRVEIIDNEAWFVAKDVCEILGLSNSRKAVAQLDEDDVTKSYIVDNLGKKQEANIISESGLYALIIRSNKPQARAFRKWVTSEVLPQIRRTGKYEPWQNGAIMYYKPASK